MSTELPSKVTSRGTLLLLPTAEHATLGDSFLTGLAGAVEQVGYLKIPIRLAAAVYVIPLARLLLLEEGFTA